MSLTMLLAVGGALVVFLLVSGVATLVRSGRDEADKKVQNRLRRLAMDDNQGQSFDVLLAQSAMSEVPWFNRLLERLRFAANISKTIRQADAKGAAGTYLLGCAVLAMAGFYGGMTATGKPVLGVVLAAALGCLPLMQLSRLKDKRMTRFHKQLPEALDLMSRALKAGHTFGGAMRMVADEFDDPIGGEFRQALDEINFGMDVDRALNNLLDRVDVADLKFFCVSVNIQRETGGNLAEIMENIAGLVRERFVLFGKVKVLSAEGRLSGLILSALPFITAGVLYVVNPDYMSLMWTTELGRNMSYGAVAGMAVGIFAMRRMVNIKV